MAENRVPRGSDMTPQPKGDPDKTPSRQNPATTNPTYDKPTPTIGNVAVIKFVKVRELFPKLKFAKIR